MDICAIFVGGYFGEEIPESLLTIYIKEIKKNNPEALPEITMHQEAYDGSLCLFFDSLNKFELILTEALVNEYVHTILTANEIDGKLAISLHYSEDKLQDVIDKHLESMVGMLRHGFEHVPNEALVVDQRDQYLYMTSYPN